MGLSASQARLLSITQRLSNNELQSELIANSKMQLSTKSTIAMDKYIAALDSTKMTYVNYDETGIQQAVALTFNAINQYTPLKNQYNIYNSEGQVLVSQTDADNFAKSKDLYDFLACYDLFDASNEERAAKKAAYDAEMANYKAELDAYNAEKTDYERRKAEYLEKLDKYYLDLEEYNEALGRANLYEIFSNAVGKSDELLAIPSTSSGLPAGLPSSKGCYWSALHPDGTSDRASCYTHVLGHIIDYDDNADNGGLDGPYTTTTGDTVICSGYASGYMDNTCNHEMHEVSEGINEKDEDGNYLRLCDKTDDYRGITGITNALEKALQDYADGTIDDTELKMWRLISDFYEKPDGTFGVKSLKQKALDLMYLSQNWEYTPGAGGEFPFTKLNSDMMVDILINFTDGDLRNLTLEMPEMPTIEPFTLEAPTPPKMPAYRDKLYDLPKSQWYTNLFYAMDGHETSDVITTEYNENAEFDYWTVPNYIRDSVNDNSQQIYKIIDKELALDENWLKFALTNGIVTIKQAALRTDGNMTWQGIEFSSTSDIQEVDDNTKIAKAEAEYKNTLAQIQAEDKQFDTSLKKLDTEHEALKAEVDSIKNVMSKNIEKSFNAFS